MRKRMLILGILILITVWLLCNLPVNAISRGEKEAPPKKWDIAWEEQGFQKIKVTAYEVGHTTANGSKVHEGGCASSAEHMGDIAILYTIDGEYIGMFEVNDAGGTDAIRNGYVIDIYRSNYQRCEELMLQTQGEAYVKYVEGNG